MEKWYGGIEKLYLARFCLLNEHLVGKHLWKICLRYGPLSTHSCFCFESFYGDLVKLKSGTMPYQTAMLFTTGYEQAIIALTEKCSIGNDTWQGKILEKLEVPVKLVQNK